jgi:hypothetical protein
MRICSITFLTPFSARRALIRALSSFSLSTCIAFAYRRLALLPRPASLLNRHLACTYPSYVVTSPKPTLPLSVLAGTPLARPLPLPCLAQPADVPRVSSSSPSDFQLSALNFQDLFLRSSNVPPSSNQLLPFPSLTFHTSLNMILPSSASLLVLALPLLATASSSHSNNGNAHKALLARQNEARQAGLAYHLANTNEVPASALRKRGDGKCKTKVAASSTAAAPAKSEAPAPTESAWSEPAASPVNVAAAVVTDAAGKAPKEEKKEGKKNESVVALPLPLSLVLSPSRSSRLPWRFCISRS